MFEPLPFSLTLPTHTLGHPLRFVREVDSTNRLLRELAHEGATPGTVLLADYQQAGRGRQGRHWAAPPGSSLLFSLLLRPPTLTPRHALLPLVTAVAVARTLASHLELRPTLKWPNDVQLAGRKVGGILVESEWDGKGAAIVVIGIGLNVNQGPTELGALPDATSLRLAWGKAVERGALLASLLHELEQALDAFAAGWEPHEAWRRRAPWLGHPLTVHPVQGDPWQGRALDLVADGSLLVERADGSTIPLRAGEVSIRPTPRAPAQEGAHPSH